VFTSTAGPSKPRQAGHGRALITGSAFLVAAGAVLAACTGSSGTAATGMPSIAHSMTTVASQAFGQHSASATGQSGSELGVTVAPAAPLIVRTGSITLQLRPGSVTRIFDQVSGQVNALGGFVSSSSTSGTTTASLVLRVPSADFSKLVGEISGDGHTLSEQLNGQDVTGESINLRARIINLTTEETSLRSLMSRAGSIPSILDVQDQLFSVEGEIEQLTAQESSLVNRASFATLDVALQSAGPAPRPARQGALSRALSLAGRNTVAVARGVLLAAGWAFPAALAALMVGAVLWVRRRRRMDGTGGEAGPAPLAAP